MSKRGTKAGLIGAVIGALAGVFLIAPKGAKENRTAVKAAANKARRDSEAKLKTAYKELQAQLDKAKSKAGDLKGRAQAEAKTLEAKAEALLTEAKELITNVREGDEDVEEQVKRVLAEAKKLQSTLATKAKKAVKETTRRIKEAGSDKT